MHGKAGSLFVLVLNIVFDDISTFIANSAYEVRLAPEHGLPIILSDLIRKSRSNTPRRTSLESLNKRTQGYLWGSIKQDMHMIRHDLQRLHTQTTLPEKRLEILPNPLRNLTSQHRVTIPRNNNQMILQQKTRMPIRIHTRTITTQMHDTHPRKRP